MAKDKEPKEKKKTDPLPIFAADQLDDFGKISIVRPTGVLPFDAASGVGGFRSSMFVELFGIESSGKTLMALLSAAYAQRLYRQESLLIDGEFAWDPQDRKKISYQVEWFRKLGGDPNKLKIYYPMKSEKTYEDVLRFIESNIYAYIIIDSWKSMTPSASLIKDIGDKKDAAFGIAATVNSEFIQQALPLLFRSDTTMLVVNHEMQKMNVMFGDPTTTPGGRALKFYAKQRPRFYTPDKKTVKGAVIRGKFIKNKIASPYATFEFPLSFSSGVDTANILYLIGLEHKIITGGGGVYYYGGIKFSGGKEKFLNALKDDIVLYSDIYQSILNKYSPEIKEEKEEDL
jgi:recombination protein RecA